MQTINLGKKEFQKLEQLDLTDTLCTEGKFYYYPEGTTESLIKCFYVNDLEYMESKAKIVKSVNKKRELFNIPEIVYPTSLLSVDGKTVGYVMPYIKNCFNLQKILSNPNYSFDEKKKYLYKICQFLEDMKNIRSELSPKEACFYLNDIHENNFIVDLEDDSIKSIDIDSAYVDDSVICPAKFLRPLSKFYNLPHKYPVKYQNDIYGPQLIPNDNTIYYSACIMILNTISGANISKLNKNELNYYLYYLNRIGYNENFIKLFLNLFEKEDNINPIEVLDYLYYTPEADYKLFRNRTFN